MKGLTKRQEAVLEFIKGFIKQKKYPPTLREIAAHFKISVKASHDHLRALAKKNYLKMHGHFSRSIELISPTDDPESLVTIPLLGSVAAGKPLFAVENLEGEVKIPKNYLKNDKYFALHVRGDSMQEAGILDGDLAIIACQEHAQNGDIVVAVLDEAVTLKRFYREKNRIMLKAENKNFAPIYTQNIKILGRLECLIRKYV